MIVIEITYNKLYTALSNCDSVARYGLRQLSKDIGIAVLGDTEPVHISWLDQVTNHQAINEVRHTKVYGPSSLCYDTDALFDNASEWHGEYRNGNWTFTSAVFSSSSNFTYNVEGYWWGDKNVTGSWSGVAFRLANNRFKVIERRRFRETFTSAEFFLVSSPLKGDVTVTDVRVIPKEKWLEMAQFDKAVPINQLYQDGISNAVLAMNNIANVRDTVTMVVDLIKRKPTVVSDLAKFIKRQRKVPISQLRLPYKEKEALIASYMYFYKKSRDEVRAMKVPVRKSGLVTAGDFWLSYRYAYNTTKADVMEVLDFSIRNRKSIMDGLLSPLLNRTFRSSATQGTTTSHLQFQFTRRGLRSSSAAGNAIATLTADVTGALIMYGFAPSLYNAWDMVPLSFVVDWIVPIGDALEARQYDEFMNLFLLKNVCYSEKGVTEVLIGNTPYTVSTYSRRPLNGIPKHDWPVDLESCFSQDATVSTKVKRLVDGLAILIG